jgi:C-terminal processing protease CtpA/Prc
MCYVIIPACLLTQILPGSAASRCGLRPGDKVVTLAGWPAGSLTHEQAQQVVLGAGTELEIVIQRLAYYLIIKETVHGIISGEPVFAAIIHCLLYHFVYV